MTLEEKLLSTSVGPQWSKVGIRHHHGLDLPLSALHSRDSCGIGEFLDLIPLIDFCKEVGMDVIQLLPLNDTGDDTSPFFAISAMALNPLFLSLHALDHVKEEELIEMRRLTHTPRVEFHQVQSHKFLFLRKYFERFGAEIVQKKAFEQYVADNPWVEDYALFKVLKDLMSKNHWMNWPAELKNLTDKQRDELSKTHFTEACFYIFLQFLCFNQLKKVKSYASERGIFLKGDIPILISPDSADVWQYTDEFDLNFSAGAPPDPYNAEGQYWGLPIFKWDEMQRKQFDWWRTRLSYAGHFYDIYRIDHVLGFFRIWAIPIGESALNGKYIPEDEARWLKHGEDILSILVDHTPMLPIAEDLGYVPESVRHCLTNLGICGTKVIRWEVTKGDHQFIDLLHYNPVSMTTVSTHDSDTLETWWLKDVDEAKPYAKHKNWQWGSRLTQSQRKEILWDSHHSASLFHINLIGEYLALFDELVWEDPEEERINVPGTISNKNWTYRIRPSIEEILAHNPLKEMIREILS